jgi:dihydroxyacid dehydratase/phosphogluconate dehydratase
VVRRRGLERARPSVARAADGIHASDFGGKPVIGIINTWSDLLPCHAHFRTRAEEVKRGVWQAGGFPVELPVMAVIRDLPEAEQHALP